MTFQPTHKETTAVFDALQEVSVTQPETASAHSRHHVTDATLREAFSWLPDEHHKPGATLGERFVASVVANARAAERSPFTVALFALDA